MAVRKKKLKITVEEFEQVIFKHGGRRILKSELPKYLPESVSKQSSKKPRQDK